MSVVSGENLSTDRGRMFKDFYNRIFEFPLFAYLSLRIWRLASFCAISLFLIKTLKCKLWSMHSVALRSCGKAAGGIIMDFLSINPAC